MSDSIAMDVRVPVGQRLSWRWLNQTVIRYRDQVGDLRSGLPTFQRRLGRYGEHEIFSDGCGERVVGRVSPNYVLVQHHELLDALPGVLSSEGYELDELYGELLLTSYGERMELVVDLPFQRAMPPDGYPLACRLRCLNSVDRSTALEAELQWYRQICSNGMFGWAGERVRRVHRFGNVLGWVQARLRRRFHQLPDDRAHFGHMTQMPVRWTELQDWADVFVARKWNKQEAARVLHICRTGMDCIVAQDLDDEMAQELQVSATTAVPGACAPVSNIYHVGQALSWVAAGAHALHTQFSRTAAVPDLLRPLMNQ